MLFNCMIVEIFSVRYLIEDSITEWADDCKLLSMFLVFVKNKGALSEKFTATGLARKPSCCNWTSFLVFMLDLDVNSQKVQ